MNTVMLVGSVGCGKTTLSQRLRDQELVDAKTQTLVWDDGVLDTPGEYVDHGSFKNALLVASYEADAVLMLDAANNDGSRLPPLFAAMFNVPVLGVVTKTDISSPTQVVQARTRLTLAGAHDVVEVSAVSGEGIRCLCEAIAGLTDSEVHL
ncbi:MAG: EutP/PduV family microcompartment system protein [Arachnia sp.]